MCGIVLHDTAESKVGQLAHIAAAIVVCDCSRLEQHIASFQVRLPKPRRSFNTWAAETEDKQERP